MQTDVRSMGAAAKIMMVGRQSRFGAAEESAPLCLFSFALRKFSRATGLLLSPGNSNPPMKPSTAWASDMAESDDTMYDNGPAEERPPNNSLSDEMKGLGITVGLSPRARGHRLGFLVQSMNYGAIPTRTGPPCVSFSGHRAYVAYNSRAAASKAPRFVGSYASTRRLPRPIRARTVSCRA